MFEWLTATDAGRFLTTFFISMLPIVELRAGLPYGIALGLDYPLALTAALVGNMIPVPFIVVYIRRVFVWLRAHFKKMDSFITKLENKAHLKGETVRKYGPLGLLIFVAIPLPGTGAWTGALIAALLDMRLKSAVPSIFLGVCIAATIMTLLTFGVIHIV
ncbi:MAG: small multi-drug export protein [Oscillospiraceae bacterium]